VVGEELMRVYAACVSPTREQVEWLAPYLRVWFYWLRRCPQGMGEAA
jgi:hypothetical protein